MSKLSLFFLGSILLLFALVFAFISRSPAMHTQTTPDATYRAALEATDPAGYTLPEPGTPEEAAMLSGIRDLFVTYTHENLEQNTLKVYAADVYFRDAFKQFSKAVDIRDYFLEGLGALDGAEFIFNRVVRSGGEFYVDWLMRLDFKSTPAGTWEESIGMSHMRYNSEGAVIFHQDYWDPTDIVYSRIPIAKQLISYVKGKM
jgi:hypothetical protein